MIVKCLCLEQRADSYTGKRGVVHQQILALLDLSPEHRLINTFDYVLSPEDIEHLKGACLRDQHVELGITAFEPAFGGRLRARGRIMFNNKAATPKA
jgi:hypothetical protein